MTDREYNALSKKLRKLTDLWVARLQLNFWHITVCVERVGQGGAGNYGGETCVGSCVSFSEYMDAVVTFYANCMADLSDAEIEKTVVHELMHLYTSHTMNDSYTDWHHERLTTDLTRLMLVAWQSHLTTERRVRSAEAGLLPTTDTPAHSLYTNRQRVRRVGPAPTAGASTARA